MDISRVADILPDGGYLFGPCVRKEVAGVVQGPTPIDVVLGDKGSRDTLIADLKDNGFAVNKNKHMGASSYKRTEYTITRDGKNVVLNVHTPNEGKSWSDVVNAKYSADVNRCFMDNLEDVDSYESEAFDHINEGTYKICDEGFGPTEQSELVAAKLTLQGLKKKAKKEVDSRKDRDRMNETTPKAQKKENNMSGTTDMGFMGMIKVDAENAMYRVASKQMTNGIKAAILTMMEKQGHDNARVMAVKDMLDTELGAALISLLLGFGLSYVPKLSEDQRVKRLAGEFRVEGMATAGNAVIGAAIENFLPVIMGALQNLPEMPAEVKPLTEGGSSETEEEEERTSAK